MKKDILQGLAFGLVVGAIYLFAFLTLAECGV